MNPPTGGEHVSPAGRQNAAGADALWRGSGHRDWPAFQSNGQPDDRVDLDTRADSHAWLGSRKQSRRHGDDHLRNYNFS